jgi:hypothetical protein
MTAKLFEQMLNLKEKIKSFPIQDYKPSSDDIVDTKNTYSKFYRLKHQETKQSSISDFFKLNKKYFFDNDLNLNIVRKLKYIHVVNTIYKIEYENTCFSPF